jgi:hypothetical protein
MLPMLPVARRLRAMHASAHYSARQTGLNAVEAKEAAHKVALKKRILALVTAVDKSKDAADLAVSALHEGLADVERKLNETDRIQRQVCILENGRALSVVGSTLRGAARSGQCRALACLRMCGE